MGEQRLHKQNFHQSAWGPRVTAPTLWSQRNCSSFFTIKIFPPDQRRLLLAFKGRQAIKSQLCIRDVRVESTAKPGRKLRILWSPESAIHVGVCTAGAQLPLEDSGIAIQFCVFPTTILVRHLFTAAGRMCHRHLWSWGWMESGKPRRWVGSPH
jgi:hypothetical protein